MLLSRSWNVLPVIVLLFMADANVTETLGFTPTFKPKLLGDIDATAASSAR